MKTITKLLKCAALLSVTITASSDGVLLSSITVPGQTFWGIELQTMVCDPPAAVDCGTPTVKIPAICASPAIMKSPIDGSCSEVDYVNPNSTCHETHWVQCPL